jgi:hypothetical protein
MSVALLRLQRQSSREKILIPQLFNYSIPNFPLQMFIVSLPSARFDGIQRRFHLFSLVSALELLNPVDKCLYRRFEDALSKTQSAIDAPTNAKPGLAWASNEP